MSKNKKILLGFDYGASSGRAMVAIWENGKIELDEVHRFSNDPVATREYFYWDTLRLFHELKEGIKKARNKYGRIDSIGIDTWGVDYVLMGKDNAMLTNPIHYRDSRTEKAIEELDRILPAEKLYEKTGLAKQPFNTIYQLYSEKIKRPELLELTKSILYTPDYFAYLLTGKMRNEYTIASTGGLINPFESDYDREILEKTGLKRDMFPEMIFPGQIYGELSDFVCEELETEKIPVIAVCTHDTASAVAAVPMADEKTCAYLSCGTWSLLGVETDSPLCTKEAFEQGFTNEGGAMGKNLLLKNINGLWLMQNLKKHWAFRHEKLSYDDIENAARESAKEGKSFSIDPNDKRFNNPQKMIDEISSYCEEKGQGKPETIGELGLAVYNGLVAEYKKSIEGLEEVTGIKIEQLNMVGGGIQDKYLSELTCKALGINVVCGPVEGSVAGNFLMQLVGLGELKDLGQCRQVIRNSFEITELS